MEHALAELPLAIFTTLAPTGAGAFIILALAVNLLPLNEGQLKKLDRFTLIPFIVSIIGIFASVLHLTQPLHAIFIYAGLITSPLVNEIAVAGIFALAAFVYCLLGLIGKLSLKLRKILSIVVAALALVFSVFIGFAYIVETIESWYNPFTVTQFLGFCLFGGTLMGTLTLGLAGIFDECLEKKSFKNSLLLIAIIGFVLSLGSMLAFAHYINGLQSPAGSGAEMMAEVFFLLIVFAVLAVLAFIGQLFLIYKGTTHAVAIVSLLLVLVAIFCARLVFYATQMSVGL